MIEAEKDLTRNFFNQNEFAERINLNGIRLTAVISHTEWKKKYGNKKLKDTGINICGVVVSVKKKDLSIFFKSGNVITLNGIKHEIVEIVEEKGVLKIALLKFGA
ncbi:hypothetical protein [Fusobacterium varium]|uniref:hypothetical protein n=1 Tax=Fusobacterium varium TaxID=856 RepID=UPI00266CF542|nr:hypothetical protein [Fusobacterium varium]